jgi:oxygen-independent coproporphyrinogen-3 oxidase
MAGIYVHIPFCKKACHYCNFHFSTNLSGKNEMVRALLSEIEMQQHYLEHQTIDTIYFGGGTPSLLHAQELKLILDSVNKYYKLSSTLKEITLEANPDDISIEKVLAWKKIGINRLSIGIQSFFEEDLVFMNRGHNASQAAQCIKIAQDGGISNLSIDLIFGFPLLSDEKWRYNVDRVLEFKVPHVSCYGMTVEPKTALASFIEKGKMMPLDEEQSASQYEYLMHTLIHSGFEQYEISNFALPGFEAVHNSNYWSGQHYLGIGPSAHSYNGVSRQWNVANNAKYMKSISQGELVRELENLTRPQQINEIIMVQLRTSKGLDMKQVYDLMSLDEVAIFHQQVEVLKLQHHLIELNQQLKLTPSGKLIADYISSMLFIDM